MNRFIIADATKCIGCRTCEVACAVSHHENQDCAALSPDEFISRIRVIKDHCWTTAVACHQCEDAPCANVCPVDAISREHGHIFVEQTRCIGCKSCMLACPFGAMEVVSSRKKARAIKCDLCWHRETGPACVEACPTKALQCMDVEKEQRQRQIPSVYGFFLNSYEACHFRTASKIILPPSAQSSASTIQ